MPTFHAGGREYLLTLDAPKIREIRNTFEGLDLADRDRTMSAYDRCSDDPVLLVDVLWILVRKQVQAAGVTAEQFGESLVGSALAEAAKALVDAYADFTPGRAPAIRTRQAKIQQLLTQAETADQEFLTDDKIRQLIETGKAENERRFQEWIQSHSATDGPEKSESAPTA